MHAKSPTRSICQATLVIPGAGAMRNIETKIYKKSEPMTGLGLDRHMYHSADLGRVRKIMKCETCDEEVTSDDVVKYIEQNGELFTVDSVEDVWGCDGEMKVISYYETQNIIDAIFNGDMHLMEPFEVAPVDFVSESYLNTFLNALSVTSHAANVNVPIRGQVRRGLIFPTGTLYTLYFEHEIREKRDPIHSANKVLVGDADFLTTLIRRNSKAPSPVRAKVTPEAAVSHLRPVH